MRGRRGDSSGRGRVAVLKRLKSFSIVILAGLTAACGGGPAPTTFDLTLPDRVGRASPGRSQLVVAEPSALQQLDSERILVRGADNTVSFIGGAQWADRLPRLVQFRVVQAFENTGRSVGRAGTGINGDLGLIGELRAFHLDAGRGEVVVEYSARLVDATSSRIIAAQVFRATEPVSGDNPGQVAGALDRALQNVLSQLVRWANGRS
jgi:cholesterol transport system auxiliary component